MSYQTYPQSDCSLPLKLQPVTDDYAPTSAVDPWDLLWALPFSLSIFTYDEVRKAIMRATGGQQREGFLYEYTYW